MLKKEIHDLLNRQINTELQSAYYYLSISLDAQHQGMTGVSNWFYVQAHEELGHSRIIQNYVNSQEAKVVLYPITIEREKWGSALEMFEDALQHEKAITELVNEIMRRSHDVYDFATSNIMNWFVEEQVEEEDACKNIIQKYRKAKDDQCTLYQIDRELRSRRCHEQHHMRGENWIS